VGWQKKGTKVKEHQEKMVKQFVYQKNQGRYQIMATAKQPILPRLKNKYKEEVVPALMKKFGYSSVMQVPRLEKSAINRGVNGAVMIRNWLILLLMN
jgi:hypothetical protein